MPTTPQYRQQNLERVRTANREYMRTHRQELTPHERELVNERHQRHARAVYEASLEHAAIVGEPWTEEEDELLMRLHREGVTYLEIAKELERTFYSVGNRLKVLRRS